MNSTTPLARRLPARAAMAGLAMVFAASVSSIAMAETPADTLVIANAIDDLKSVDPAQSFELSGGDVVNNVYDKLVELNPQTLQMVPGIADSWSVDDAGTTFTFKLKDGLKFASGNPVRAEDAAWSLQRVVKLNFTPAFIITQLGLTADNVDDKIKAVDDHTMTLQTDKPYAPSFVYNLLTADCASILDKKVVMEHASGDDMGNEWLSTHSAASGPFTLRSWSPNESVILEANDNFREKPPLSRVYVRHVAEPATQRLLLENGDVDIARNLTPEDIDAVRKKDGLKVYEQRRGRIYYLSGNQLVEPLDKPKVMQAIKYLIDYKGMENSFLRGKNAVQQAFIPQGILGSLKDTPFKLDVDKAKSLLAEAGVPNGFDTQILVRNQQERIDIAQALQASLAKAGINASIRQVTGSEALSIYRAREHQLTLQTWGPDYPDPNTNASVFAANPDNSKDAQLTGNLAWRNAFPAEKTTPMVTEALLEKDPQKRAALYEKIQKISQESSPFIPMFQQVEQAGMAEDVEGFSAGGAVSSAFYWQVSKDGKAN